MGKGQKKSHSKLDSSNTQLKSNRLIPNRSTPVTNKSQIRQSQNLPSMIKEFSSHMGLKAILLVLVCIAVQVIYSWSTEGILTDKQTASNSDFCTTGEDEACNIPVLREISAPTLDTQVIPSDRHTENVHDSDQNLLPPTVFIGILVRNKAHTLPYFLHGLEIQDYMTQRIQLLFLTDNSIDDSSQIISHWINSVKERYHHVDLEVGDNHLEQTKMWSTEHYQHVILLRQRLLNAARKSWADFYLTIDADVILMNSNTLKHLVETAQHPTTIDPNLTAALPVVSPLMNCTSSEFYANFWGAMGETGYYARSDNYFAILRRELVGLFQVPMVHSIFLINLRHRLTEKLQYFPSPLGYEGPTDDLIIFAITAQLNNVPFYLDNSKFYGYLPAPVEEDDLTGSGTPIERWLRREEELFVHLRLQALLDQEDRMRVLPSNSLLNKAESQLPPRSKLGFDEIYYINLLRRPDRQTKMEYFLDQLGIAARHVPAVDGKLLTLENITKLGIKQLPGYADPYHKRSLKFGEIGCFLSHYRLWQEMEEHGYQRILILEDDVRFSPGFVRNLAEVIQEADTFQPDWDLLYIGRKRMSKNEKRVPGSSKLSYPEYTYWTLGYILKRSGAKKLLAQDPLKRMVAVDEYLPIMFNKHPQKAWLEQFEPRNLVALSAEPLLIEPQRYVGEQFYISDTEDSEILRKD